MVQIPVPNEDCVFDYTKHHRHILFCGTVMIHGRCEANSYLKAVVIRTGIAHLIIHILYPQLPTYTV